MELKSASEGVNFFSMDEGKSWVVISGKFVHREGCIPTAPDAKWELEAVWVGGISYKLDGLLLRSRGKKALMIRHC